MSTNPDTPVACNTKHQVLADHYKETFELLKAVTVKRDRFYLYILIVVFLLLLYMSAPIAISDWLNTFITEQSGGSGTYTYTGLIDSSFVGAILLLGLLVLSHTYFQTVLHVERQYDYIYLLEEQLSGEYNGKAFIREGEHYRKNKRKFSNWTVFIFWVLSPLLFLTFIIVWLIFLFGKSGASCTYLVVDSMISLSMLTSLVFYVLALIKQK